jgi:O-antigen/teichoic acid export membrane protein
VGVVLGFLTTGILFPRILSTDEVGLLRLLVSYSTLLAQFAVLGVNTVTVKLFPLFRDEQKKHHGYLGLTLLVALAGFVVTTAVYLGLHDYIINKSQEKSALFIPYFFYVIPLVFFTLLFGIFDTYYRVLYRAVIGIVYKEVVQRTLILLSVLLYFFKLIDFHTLVIIYSVALVSPAIFLFFHLAKDKLLYLKPDFGFIDKKLAKEMLSVAFFGIVASYSGVLVMNIDIIMVNNYLGLKAAGIYTITFFFGTLILVPMRTMGKISSVVIADAWKNNDKKTIFDIYRKSTLSLGIIGLLLFVGIVGNLDNVFRIIGKDYEAGRMVIIFIGLANLTDIFLGISPHIIVNSNKYRWLSYLLIGFTVIIIISNLVFIPLYGLIGAALASFISKTVYNLSKYLFLYKTWGFQPYTIKHFALISAAIIAYLSVFFLPPVSHFIVDIIVRSAIITTVFTSLVYWWKISDEVNLKIKKLVKTVTGNR